MSQPGNVVQGGVSDKLLPPPVGPTPMRILLVGSPAFCHNVAELAHDIPARVVGRAHTRSRAVELAASLAADVAVVGGGMASIADRLSERGSVIILSSDEDAESQRLPATGVPLDHDLLRLLTSFAGIQPPAPPVSLEPG